MEAPILRNLRLHKTMVIIKHTEILTKQFVATSSHSSPPIHFVQLKFDRASKGNLGIAGFGGIFRDEKLNPLRIYAMDCGQWGGQ